MAEEDRLASTLTMGCRSCAEANLLGAAAGDSSPFVDHVAVPEAILELYRRAIVIDALATPNTFNVDYPPAAPELSGEQLENVRRSGITAVNHTIFAVDVADHERKIGWMKADIARHPDTLMLIERPSDILAAKAAGKLGIILGFQGMEFLTQDLSLIDHFAASSVRIMQPTYNQESDLGSGCLSAAATPGLKPLGKAVVEGVNRRQAVVDLSHSHPQTALDAVEASSQPVIVSHSGCHALHVHPRNHPDEVLRAVAGSGGVFGIYLMPFLGSEPRSASRDLVTRHLLHALNVCGEDHVGIGSDNSITPLQLDAGYFDALESFVAGRRRDGSASPSEGVQPFMVPGLNSPRRLEIIAWDLSRAGCSDQVIEKILGRNFLRVFDQIWPD
ncbi:dipeptidase [Sphingomonas sp. Root710]|uniref:dipeptidase n=1 Tax=Sphingomonas sp. Root710 TaxID=1736594 RepID=UPI00138F2F2A|nr:membrane dipeptidase [Sphingomonas sp. Root710]